MTHHTLQRDGQTRPKDLPGWLASRVTVCLDFDGVFLDSNAFKVQCMRAALSDFDATRVDAFLAYFRMNFGNSRQQHFGVFHREYLRDGSDFDSFYARYSARYARLVSDGYSALDLTPGCRDLLETLNTAGLPCHIVTGGDPAQVRAVLKAQAIDTLIASVRGAPVKKAHHIRDILTETGCGPQDTLLFGDGAADCRAAVETGLDFVFVSRFSFITPKVIGDITPSFRVTRDLSRESLAVSECGSPQKDPEVSL